MKKKQKQKKQKVTPQGTVILTSEFFIILIEFFVVRTIVNGIRNLVYAQQEAWSLDPAMLDRVFSATILTFVCLILVVLLRINAWTWRSELGRFQQSQDYQRFRNKLIPLSRQFINPLVQSKAQINLAWVHSYLGESKEAKDVCRKVISQKKDAATKAIAYTVLIQELILEGDLTETKQVWEEAKDFIALTGRTESIEALKCEVFGSVIQERFEEGLQAMAEAPEALRYWVDNSEDCMFWSWYLNWKLGRNTASYRKQLRELPALHHGFAKAMKQENIEKK